MPNTNFTQYCKTISQSDNFSDCVKEIASCLSNDEMSNPALKTIISKHNIQNIQDIKPELLNFIIGYMDCILSDNIIGDLEKHNIKYLKTLFRIKEGDFLKFKQSDIARILHEQFMILYSDNKISKDESIHNAKLQSIFDLSYDQFDEFRRLEISRALKEGAKITDLDTALRNSK